MLLKSLKFLFGVAFLILVGACATVRDNYPTPEPSFASQPGPIGPFADLETAFAEKHGSKNSGFILLETGAEALNWLLTLIDEARYSLDMQYYQWYGDDSGELLFKRVLDAAKRGVRVRLIADSIRLIGKGETVAAIDARPNIEIRIFNPWEQDVSSDSLQSAPTLERFNNRMHNKLTVADNRITILGGRNLGNEYFGLNSTHNFLDLDVLGVGPVARQVSGIFDHFWNSPLVVPGYAFVRDIPGGRPHEIEQANLQVLKQSKRLQSFSLKRRDWSNRLGSLIRRLHPGKSTAVYDLPESDTISQKMATAISAFHRTATNELLICNAYLIPDEHMLEEAREMAQNGVKLRILTNSLGSQDLPAVNSHYGPMRKRILETGIELYELRWDAAIKNQVDTPPVVSESVGLHAKTSVVDRTRVYIGSFNLDPRGRNINTEMGVLINSPELGEKLARLIESYMEPQNSWRVRMNKEGDIVWQSGDEILTRQPARNSWQRVQDAFFKLFPKEQF